MIRAFIFDMDGTLVQTERLKALSYAKATVELCPVAAGMACVAVTTPYSRTQIRLLDELDDRWKVDDPGMLLGVVRELLAEHGGGTGLE